MPNRSAANQGGRNLRDTTVISNKRASRRLSFGDTKKMSPEMVPLKSLDIRETGSRLDTLVEDECSDKSVFFAFLRM